MSIAREGCEGVGCALVVVVVSERVSDRERCDVDPREEGAGGWKDAAAAHRVAGAQCGWVYGAKADGNTLRGSGTHGLARSVEQKVQGGARVLRRLRRQRGERW